MKKLTVLLSILFVTGLLYQGMVYAEAGQSKNTAKCNFTPKKKHAVADAAATTAPAPAQTATPAA